METAGKKYSTYKPLLPTGQIKWKGHNYSGIHFKNVLLEKLTYPLMVTCFTEPQCHLIMKPILNISLLKAWVVQMYPRVLVYGPSCYVGLAIPNLYAKQLVVWLGMVLWFGGQESNTTTTLIHALVEALQLETGLRGKFSELPMCVTHLV